MTQIAACVPDRSVEDRHCIYNLQLGCLDGLRFRLVRVADNQNHSRPENLRIPVIALQSSYRGLVGTRNRVERFTLFDFVLNDAGVR